MGELGQFNSGRFSSIPPLIRDRGGGLGRFFAEMDPGPVNFLNFPIDSQRRFSRGWPKSVPEHTIIHLLSSEKRKTEDP